ncbi:MAG: flagellar FliJ family protein [Leptospirales bacterium]|nr:flagellar FliJ family protein [Leptospirales bacterium]
MRRRKEEEALGQLARVMLRVNVQQSARDQAARLVREEMDRFEGEYQERFDIDLFKIYDRYIERLENEERVAVRKLDEIRPELEAEMQKVMEARKQRRIVELLKERQYAQYKQDLRRMEKRELDEANRLRNRSPLIAEDGNESRIRRKPKPAAAPEPLGEGIDPKDLVEPEQPQPPRDYVQEYLRQRGLDRPGA